MTVFFWFEVDGSEWVFAIDKERSLNGAKLMSSTHNTCLQINSQGIRLRVDLDSGVVSLTEM